MGQKLLLFISIVLLFAFNGNAETDANLPALPTDSTVKLIDQNESEEISLWQKILNFFGFGNKEKVDKKPIEKEESKETQTADDSNGNITQQIEKNKDTTINMSKIDDGQSQDEDLDIDNAIKKITENTPDDNKANLDDNDMGKNQDTDALSIPKGFEDDGPLKLPELPEGMSDRIDSENEEKRQNVEDNTDNSANKMLPEIPAVSSNNSSDTEMFDNADQKALAADTNDLKLPDGFDDMKSEDTKLPDMPIPNIPEINRDEQKLEKAEDIVENKESQAEDLPLLPPVSSEGLTDLSEKTPVSKDDSSTSMDESPVSTDSSSVPAKDSKDSVDIENNSADNMKEITLPASDEAVPSSGDIVKSEDPKSSESNNKSQTDTISDISLPAPDYASIPDEPKKQESSIEKFTRAFTNKKSKQIELPKITEEDYASKDDETAVEKGVAGHDATQLQFVNNEAQVLILPNDDVVLGKLTEQAKINEMDLHTYIKKFWENYNRLKREPQREVIERFIEEYDENFNQENLD